MSEIATFGGIPPGMIAATILLYVYCVGLLALVIGKLTKELR